MVAPLVGAAAIGAGAKLVGGVADKIFSDKASKQNWKQQKKVLQNQVQWRVADSVKAGLHPLAALGMSPAAAGGTYVGGTDFASMGQDIGRAAEALMSPEYKGDSRVMQLAVERGQLENELLRSQIASQRFRNIHEGTPGLSGNTGGGLRTIPSSGIKYTPAVPGAAQTAEDDFGELAGWAIGADNALTTWARYRGLERMLTDPVGESARIALEWTKRLQGKPKPRPTSGFKAQYLGGR